jgi:hypothetical protein
MLDRERLSGCEKLMNNFAVLGFEPTALGRGEAVVGQMKIRDGFQRLSSAAELFFNTDAKRPHGRRGEPRRADRIQWM